MDIGKPRRRESRSWIGAIKIWDIATGRNINTLQENSWIISLEYSENSGALIFMKGYIFGECCGNNELSRYDIGIIDSATSRIVKIISRQNSIGDYHTSNLAIHKGRIAFGDDKEVKIVGENTGSISLLLQPNAHWGTSISFDDEGELLLAASVDAVNLWNTNTGQLLLSMAEEKKYSEEGFPQGRYYSAAISPEGDKFVTTDWGSISVWKLTN